MKRILSLLLASLLVLQVFSVPIEEDDESREKRGIMGPPPGVGLYGGPEDPDNPAYSPVAYPGGPMAPYLAMKPFIPSKPKPFASSFVDPNYFIAQKAKLLGGIFPPQATTIDDISTLEKRQAPEAPSSKDLSESFGGVPPQQMIMSPDFWMYPTPAPKPTIVPPGYWSPFGPGASPFGPGSSPFGPGSSPFGTGSSPFGGAGSSPGSAGPGPVIDPNFFIGKKTKFLNDLFAAKAASTPAPPVDPADVYASKVDEFLANLREALNVTTPPKIVKREATASEISSDSTGPKDKVLSSILDELSSIKDSMLATASEIIKQQQTVASVTSKVPKKPLPPAGSIGAYWAAKGAAASAAADPLAPFQKRLDTLGQVFDMLTQLEKDLTSALEIPTTTTTVAPPTQAEPQVNITALVNALRKAQDTPIGTGPLYLGPAYPPSAYSGLYAPSMRRRRSTDGYYARDYPGQPLPQRQQQQLYPQQQQQQQQQQGYPHQAQGYSQYQQNSQGRGKERKSQESDAFNYNILEFIQDQLNRRHHHHHQ